MHRITQRWSGEHERCALSGSQLNEYPDFTPYAVNLLKSKHFSSFCCMQESSAYRRGLETHRRIDPQLPL